MSDIKKKYNDNKLKSGASEVIPKYAKALKLLKAREGSFDKITEKINSVIVEICAKETIDTEEDLLHTNYVETTDQRLLKFPIYQRTKNDVLPVTFYRGEKFPIIPFGNNQVSDDYKRLIKMDVATKLDTLGAYNLIFGGAKDSLKLGSTSNAMDQTFSEFTNIEVLFKTASIGNEGKITLEGADLKNYILKKLGNSKQGTLNHNSFKPGDSYKIEIFYIDENGKEQSTNTIFAYKYFNRDSTIAGIILRNTQDLNYNDEVMLQYETYKSTSVEFSVKLTPNFSASSVTSSVMLKDNEFIVTNGEIEFSNNFTNVDYYAPSDYKPGDTSNSLGDHWTSIEYPKSDLTKEDVATYLAQTNQPDLDSKKKLIEYQALIDEVLRILKMYDSLNGKYLLSTTENAEGIGSIEELENDSKHIKMRVNFTNDEVYNHIQKQNVTLTVERPNCNDLQFIELPIAQRISDALLLAELFQIFQVKSNGQTVDKIMVNENDAIFFSKNLDFDLVGITDTSIKNAYKASFERGVFSVEDFYGRLFPTSEVGSKQKAKLSGTNYYETYDVVGQKTTGKLWWKKTVDVRDWVKHSKTCTKEEYVDIKSAKRTLTLVPTTPKPAVYTLYRFNSENSSFESYEFEVPYEEEKEVSKSRTYKINFANKTASTSYEISLSALLTFVEQYNDNLKTCFSGYEKPIKSISLYDIIVGDIYSESDINKKYYFKRIEADYPILEVPLKDISLIDQGSESNSETQNKFFLTSVTNKYIPKTITTENNLLKELIILEKSEDEFIEKDTSDE